VKEVKNGYHLLIVDADNEVDEVEIAADYFYSHLQPRKKGCIIFLEYKLSTFFSKMMVDSFTGNEVKSRIPEVFYIKEYSKDNANFYFSCLVGYLLKNFWHNYTHRYLQVVDTYKYRDFGGHSNFEADFQADLCCEVLILCSYGLNPSVFTRSTDDNPEINYIEIIQEMSRSARPFEARAKIRSQRKELDKTEYLEDKEWRIRRRISSELVRFMLQKGFFPGSISVYFPGNVTLKNGGYIRDTTKKICATINGFRISSAEEYIGPDQYYSLSQNKKSNWIKEITNSLFSQYKVILSGDMVENRDKRVARTGRLRQQLLSELGVVLKRTHFVFKYKQ